MQAENDIENMFHSCETSPEWESLSHHYYEHCISKVPERLRSVNEQAYTPKVVSIGPLHHGKADLRAMEEEKIRYLQHYLRGRERPAEKYYSSKIKNQEARLRSCYSETIEFSSDEPVRIILVDAAFIIEILLRYYFPELQDENDYILKEPHLLQAVSCDSGLLENQLPFFILEDLFDPNIINCVGTERPSIASLSYHFFKILMHMEGTCQTTLERLHCSGSKDHFVNLLRNVYLSTTRIAKRREDQNSTWHDRAAKGWSQV